MTQETIIDKQALNFESRLSKNETVTSNLKDDIGEVKRDLRWLIGVVVSFNTTILGVIARGFHWI